MGMILRFRGPDGMERITIDPPDTFGALAEKVKHIFHTRFEC